MASRKSKTKYPRPVRTEKETIGRARLRDWLECPGNSRALLARMLEERGRKLSAEAIFYWSRGTSRPTQPFRLALEALLGIPANDWMTPKERDFSSPDATKKAS